MRLLTWLHHQLADLVTDFLITGLAALLPATWTNRLLWRVAGIRWLFPGAIAAIGQSEAVCFASPRELDRQWAWTTLMEAAQAWRLLLRLRPRLIVRGEWPAQTGFIAAGMHYGAGINALWHLHESGLRPRFVFRPVAASDLPGRPVKLMWYRLRTRLIMRLCPDGPISTGGAGRRILDVVHERQATPVVLFDTPTSDNSGWPLQVGKAQIHLRSGGAKLFARAGADLVFFVAAVNRQTGQTELAIEQANSGEDAMARLMSLMTSTMRENPGQWLLWHSVPGLFTPCRQTPEAGADR